MNYYFSVVHRPNRYKANVLTQIAIVSEDGRQIWMQGYTKAKFRKYIKAFTNDGTVRVFYSYISPLQFSAFYNVFNQQLPENYPTYFRDLKFLEDYIGEKNNFGIQEDSNYPFAEPNETPIDNAKRLKQLHQFLIDFELNLQVRAIRKKIGI